jgi:hypothetical protein
MEGLEATLGRYCSRSALTFRKFLQANIDFPVVLTTLPFLSVEQLLFALTQIPRNEIYEESESAEQRSDAERGAPAEGPCRCLHSEEVRRGGNGVPPSAAKEERVTPSAAKGSERSRNPASRPAELAKRSQGAPAPPQCQASQGSGKRLALIVGSAFDMWITKLEQKYGARRGDFADLAHAVIAKEAIGQRYFLAVYVGPQGLPGKLQRGPIVEVPAYRAQRIFQWQGFGGAPLLRALDSPSPFQPPAPGVPPSAAKEERVTPSAAKGSAPELLLCDFAARFECSKPMLFVTEKLNPLPALHRRNKRQPKAATPTTLGKRVSLTIDNDEFAPRCVRRAIETFGYRLRSVLVRCFLIGENPAEVPFVTFFVERQTGNVDKIKRKLLRTSDSPPNAAPSSAVFYDNYDVVLLRDMPWTNVTFREVVAA